MMAQFHQEAPFGEVAERLIALVLKTRVGETTGGSNPSFTATEAWVSGLNQEFAKLPMG